MEDTRPLSSPIPTVITTNTDVSEARLESQEVHKYLLAKSYFDCREYERCAAVFLPSGLPRGPLSSSSPKAPKQGLLKPGKGKSKDYAETAGIGSIPSRDTLSKLSQKALFLALYAKFMVGEKRKDEECEMVLGPADGGSTVNRELVGIARALEGWFASRNPEQNGGGWLEYLYGVVLSKGKNEDDAKRWLLRSVHLCPFNWGAWLELSELLGSVEEVRSLSKEPSPSTDLCPYSSNR